MAADKVSKNDFNWENGQCLIHLCNTGFLGLELSGIIETIHSLNSVYL